MEEKLSDCWPATEFNRLHVVSEIERERDKEGRHD